MKKLYSSTFVPGMEEAVVRLLRHEGGVTVERVSEGMVLYRSVREPDFPYLHHTFMVLTQLQGVKTLDEAVKRLLAQGEWLDRMPYETLGGKKFRIVTMNDGQLEHVNMRYLNMLEKVITDHTGMHTLRERPDVELWIDRRTPGSALFMWRLGARRGAKAAAPGALRPDLCAIIAALCRIGGKNVVDLLARDETLLSAFYAAGAKSVSAVCPGEKEARVASHVARVRVLLQPSQVAPGSVQAVAAHLPERIESETPQKFVRTLVLDGLRMLDGDGVMALIALRGQAENVIDRTPGVGVRARYDVAVSGKNTVVWLLCAEDEEQAEESGR